MSQKILVVEDEVDVRELIVLHLKRLGHAVTAVGSIEEARGAMAALIFDLAVVDWMLPGASGVDFIREIRRRRERADFAILMLTAKSEPKDIIEGLDAGADDYISKPFDAGVLLARVRALSRRLIPSEHEVSSGMPGTGVEKPGMSIVKLGQLHLYPETYEVKCCGEPIALTPSEFKLLMALSKSLGRVLTRDSLISQIQGEGVSVVGRTVDTHVFGLRKKLGACADVIETVRGVGYRVKPDLEA